ncbi:pyridoxal phosphate-dependent aminotransferase [soil metagenome]
MLAALDEPDRRPSRGLPELRRAIADELAQRSNVVLDPEREILVTNGAMQALNIVCRALLEAGDEVVIPTPNFFMEGVVRLAHGDPVYVPCAEDDGWRWDLDRIEAAVTPRSRVIFACNPTNPTGYLPSRRDIEALCDVAERHDLVVLADESYDRFIYDGARFTCVLELRGRSPNLVLVRSLSKSHGLGAWRIGYIAAEPELLDAFVKVLEWECLHCAYVPQRVATAVLEGPREWLGDLSADYQSIRDRLWPTVSASEWLSCVKPQAAPFFFLDVRRAEAVTGEDGSEMLLAAGIPTVAGRHFQGPGYVRLPFGADQRTVDQLDSLLASFRPTPPSGP